MVNFTTKKDSRGYAIKVFVEERGTVLGSAYLYIMYNDLHTEPFGFLENVFVNEESRGKGIGTELVKKVIEQAEKEGCYKLICTSRYDNSRVHAFYEKLGFKDFGKEFRMELK